LQLRRRLLSEVSLPTHCHKKFGKACPDSRASADQKLL
jgi:hypothetical protein